MTASSIHVLRKKYDFLKTALPMITTLFQSTYFVRSTTIYAQPASYYQSISILVLREKYDTRGDFSSILPLISIPVLRKKYDLMGVCAVVIGIHISIHILREKYDPQPAPTYWLVTHFNPHCLRRQWPSCAKVLAGMITISIHTAYEGSDRRFVYTTHCPITNFNPHCLRRQWPSRLRITSTAKIFQSTLPAKAVTEFCKKAIKWHKISIHTACEGSDSGGIGASLLASPFQSTLPAKAVTLYFFARRNVSNSNFNPHCLRRQWHGKKMVKKLPKRFQSTLPAKAVTWCLPAPFGCTSINFNPHCLRRQWPNATIHQELTLPISIHTACEGSDDEEIPFWRG